MIKAIMNRLNRSPMDSSLHEVVRGASSSLVVQVTGSILGLAASLVIARTLGAGGVGIYYLAMSIVAIASTFGRVGLDNTIVRFVASYAAKGDWPAVKFVNRAAVRIAIVASLVVSIVIIIGMPFLSERVFHKHVVRIPVVLAGLTVVPFSLYMVHAESLRGLKEIVSSQLIKNVLVAAGTLVFIYPATRLMGANGSVLSYSLAVWIAGAGAWLIWHKRYGDASAEGPRDNVARDHKMTKLIIDSLPLFGVSVSNLVIQYGATIMLGIWGGIDDVGIFSAASRVASLFLFPLFAMINILSPKYAAMHQEGDVDGMARLAQQSSRMLTAITIPFVGLVFFTAGRVLSVFGAQFVAGSTMLRILLIGIVTNISTGAVTELLMMTGHGNIVNRVIFVGAASVVALGAVLMPIYGGLGAAIALSAGYVIINLLMLFSVRRTLGFWAISWLGRAHSGQIS